MSAVRALPDIAAHPGRPAYPVPGREQTKRPDLKIIAGQKGTRVAAVRSPLTAKTPFGFFVLCLVVLLTSLAVVQILQANIALTPFELQDLNKEIVRVEREIQAKESELHLAENNLANQAREMGMVPQNGARQQLYLSKFVAQVTGEVVGGVSVRDGR